MQHSLYETVFIARQDLSTEDLEALVGKFSKIITDEKGKISYEYWGLRNLAFPIKKNTKGHYVLLNITATKQSVSELKRIMSYNENIIRSITFVVNYHSKESSLCVNIKDPNAKKEKKEEGNNLDLILSQIQFEA
jgi:small subunit ribosomal protein S6